MDTIAELSAAIRAFRDEVRASYPEADFHMTIEGGGGSGGKRFCSYLRLHGWSTLMLTHQPIIRWGATPEEALLVIREAFGALPRVWTAADVAATLGLPICAWCDEAPATHDSHDDHYAPLGSRPERVCEPCLERAADRQVERAMEG